MQKKFQTYGIMIICKSIQMSKFKLVLFDKEGAVRYIQVKIYMCRHGQKIFLPVVLRVLGFHFQV